MAKGSARPCRKCANTFATLYWKPTALDSGKTHTIKFCGSTGLVRSVLPYSFSGFFSALHCLDHKAAHPLCLLLHFVGDVGVGVQCEARRVAPQDVGYRLGIHPLLDRQGGEGVSQTGEGNMMGLTGCLVCSWTSRATVSSGGKIVRTELAVLGWVTFTSPLMRPADLEMLRVRVFQVKVIQGHQFRHAGCLWSVPDRTWGERRVPPPRRGRR